MTDTREPLREAVNVPDLMERDKLVTRLRKMRADAVLDKHTIERWNRLHSESRPIATDFEDAMIAWCDGKGPFPELPKERAMSEALVCARCGHAEDDHDGYGGYCDGWVSIETRSQCGCPEYVPPSATDTRAALTPPLP